MGGKKSILYSIKHQLFCSRCSLC